MRVAVLVLLVLFGGCSTKVVYKCPKGQVMVLENGVTERCYVPGISYTDYRPTTVERIDELKGD